MTSINAMVRQRATHSSPARDKAALETFRSNVAERAKDVDGKSAQKTVNLRDLMDNGSATNSDGDPVGWNPFEIGSQEWFDYGEKHGVWIGGKDFDFSAEEFLRDIDLKDAQDPDDQDSNRFENAVRTLRALADGLQMIQDEIVKLAANGASADEIGKFAKRMLVSGPPMSAGDMAGQKFDGEENYFSSVFQFVMIEDPKTVERKFLNKITDGGHDDGRREAGMRLVNSLLDTLDFRGVEEELGIEVLDDQGLERDLNDQTFAITADMRREIDRLPLHLQAEAWKILSEELDTAVDAAKEGDTPDTPDYERNGGWDPTGSDKKNTQALINYKLAYFFA
ncbi:MAG: hypothetical protein H6730_37490 [Deltaproteobacteria bacterium]|nr:hypothetical protein [Deltaproteobacteria bacterium]